MAIAPQPTRLHPRESGSPTSMQAVVNAFSVDVEDYFQVSAFERYVDRQAWSRFDSRVCANTEKILDILERQEVRGTFFVLGWIAERFPELVRRIHRQGHELASHSYSHRLVYELTPEDFRRDLRRARAAIEDAVGVAVVGYRAPSFSITRRSLWALDVLVDEGYEYDASIYPIHHDRYGIPDWPRHPHRVERSGGALWEVPGSTTQFGGMNLPIGGGGYFRLLPYGWTKAGIARVNRREQQPAVFYLHPWELDPDQPRIAASRSARFRHYRNLRKTAGRLERLLTDFRFGTVRELLQRTVAPAATKVAGPANPFVLQCADFETGALVQRGTNAD